MPDPRRRSPAGAHHLRAPLGIGLTIALVLAVVANPARPTNGEDYRSGDPLVPSVRDFPDDPSSDVPWSAGTSTVGDVETAFNTARASENSQLGLSLPLLELPSQAAWDAMSNGERALWLMNRERIDRGVEPLTAAEASVTGVAQAYAEWLLANDAWGHTADGSDPVSRMGAHAAIGACRDPLSVSENLAVFATSGTSIGLPVERAVYRWMYDDGSCCGWGHRHAILWYPYDDNSGFAGEEGFLGIGRASGGPYQGPFEGIWNFAELIVMNVFDPCSAWLFADDFEMGGTAFWSAVVE